jgi:ABC-type dipeptide/oligopeptide/nickel transport system permease subunit
MAEQKDPQDTNDAQVSVIDADTREISKRPAASQIWYFFRRWPLIPLFIMIVLVFTGVFAPFVAPVDPFEQSLGFRNYGPTWGQATPEFNTPAVATDFDLTTTKGKSAFSRAKKNFFPRSKYILGADNLGRDVLSRIIYGARISLKVTAYALTSGIIVGSLLAGVLGYIVVKIFTPTANRAGKESTAAKSTQA